MPVIRPAMVGPVALLFDEESRVLPSSVTVPVRLEVVPRRIAPGPAAPPLDSVEPMPLTKKSLGKGAPELRNAWPPGKR